MSIKQRHQLLVFEDIVGVGKGYKTLFEKQLLRAGINPQNTRVVTRSSYLTFTKKQHLEWKKTRKQPGFNTDPAMQRRVRQWVLQCIADHKPHMIICFDPALLFILNPDWSQATLDKLRGGLYIEFNIPWLVTLPMTALHNKAKATDIAKLNQGFIEKGEFDDFKKELDYESLSNDDSEDEDDERSEEDDNDKASMEWHEPLVIPFGKIMLDFDFNKAGRILSRIPVEDVNSYLTAKGV